VQKCSRGFSTHAKTHTCGFIFLRQVCVARPCTVNTAKDTGVRRAFMPKGSGGQESDKSDSGKKRSARTRFIVMTAKTRHVTAFAAMWTRCGFSARRLFAREQMGCTRAHVTSA